jgi:hypothetical protein
MIAKEFISAKTFHAHSVNFFRDDKSLRDHGGPARLDGVPLITRASLRRRSTPARW